MYREPIFLEPVFQERIWGGKKIKDEFHYDIPNDKTGEAWVISAHPHGPSVIRNGKLAGKTLAVLGKIMVTCLIRMRRIMNILC